MIRFITALTLSLLPGISLAYQLNDSDLKRIIASCTPSSYHEILFKIAKKESSKRVFALNVNGKKLKKQPKDMAEVREILKELKGSKYTYDMGVWQINSSHFRKDGAFGSLGYKHEDAFNVCTGAKMAAFILDEAFGRVGTVTGALSIYNTGSPTKGLKNGYVASVFSQ